MLEQKWEELSLWSGKIKVAFYPNKHFYCHIKDGKPERKSIKSVSKIASIAQNQRPLKAWQEKIAREHLIGILNNGKNLSASDVLEALALWRTFAEEEASKGKIVHQWAEDFAQAEIGGLDRPIIDNSWQDEVKNGINAFVDWWVENDVKFIKTEQVVYSKKYNFIGKFDAIAKINGETVLIDYKTSSGIYPEAKKQACGYAIAYEEEYGETFDQLIILHFDKKTGEFSVHTVNKEERENYCKAFIYQAFITNLE